MQWVKDKKCLKRKNFGVVRTGFPFDHYFPSSVEKVTSSVMR